VAPTRGPTSSRLQALQDSITQSCNYHTGLLLGPLAITLGRSTLHGERSEVPFNGHGAPLTVSMCGCSAFHDEHTRSVLL
jgi:hypothetical protein